MLLRSFLIACLSSCLVVRAQDQPDYGFSFPNATDVNDQNIAFVLGEILDIQWVSPFSSINLAFIPSDGDIFTFIDQGETGTSFSWAVNVNNSGSSSPYYYLYFENSANNTENYYSAEFRVDEPVNAAASTETTSTTAHPTTTPKASLVASPTTEGGTTVFITKGFTSQTNVGVSPSTNSPTADTGLSSSAKVGIGVGVPLGVIALIGLGVLGFWLSWRHSRAAKGGAPGAGPFTAGGGQGAYSTPGGYGSPGIMTETDTAYGGASAYQQHSAKIAAGQASPQSSPKPYGYTPVEQHAIYELPPEAAHIGPHEIGTSETSSDFRGYR